MVGGSMPFTLATAIGIAAMAHKDRKDKTQKPYIFHPLTVMMHPSLQSQEEHMAAVLHDVLEDTKITVGFLRSSGCPEVVLQWLDFLTKRKEEEHDYEAYIDRIARAPSPVIRVKLADLCHNKDLSRFVSPTERDIVRTEKYERAHARLRHVLESREFCE